MNELTLDIYKISRCTHNYYARELRKIHITMGQFPFLMGIGAEDGISQEQLSSHLRISKSTTTAIIRQLLEAGLVEREVNEGDRRNFRLHATAKALALIPQIEAIIARCHEMMTADLSPAEREIFVHQLEIVRARTESALLSSKKKAKQ